MSFKTPFLIVSLLFGLLLVPSSYAETSNSVQDNYQSIVLNVQNMTCAMCKFTIKKALTSVSGIKKVSVSFKDKTANVTFDPNKTSSKALINAVTNAGYPATVQSSQKLKTE